MTYPISEIDGLTAFTASKLKSVASAPLRAVEAASTVKGRRGSRQTASASSNCWNGPMCPTTADSRHGQGKGRAGGARRRHHGSRARASHPARLAQNMKEGEYQAQSGPRFALGKGGRATDCKVASFTENYLLELFTCRTGRRRGSAGARTALPTSLTPMHGPGKATRMIAITSRPVPAAARPIIRCCGRFCPAAPGRDGHSSM